MSCKVTPSVYKCLASKPLLETPIGAFPYVVAVYEPYSQVWLPYVRVNKKRYATDFVDYLRWLGETNIAVFYQRKCIYFRLGGEEYVTKV